MRGKLIDAECRERVKVGCTDDPAPRSAVGRKADVTRDLTEPSRFKVRGDVESMSLQAQPTGTIVAQNLSAPTSSIPSAISGSSVSCDHVFALSQTRSFELVQQQLDLFQVGGVEALGVLVRVNRLNEYSVSGSLKALAGLGV